ncbi:MAG: protein kinase, partial [Elusimicrobiota bacterium]
MDEIIGSELGGCRVLERLGGGGMGTVYKAHHLRLDRDVALKVLAPDLAADPGFVVAFEREARSAARLEHPRIVQVYDAGAQDELHYILMQLIDGETALDRVAREGRLNPLDALRIIKAACEGLGVAHKQGIVHRDVKPGNILLGKDGTIRLSDFGLAMRVSDPGGSGEIRIIGTAQYLAPELGWGGEAEARSDIYSMGATYFCLLAGEPPFQGETDADTVAMH